MQRCALIDRLAQDAAFEPAALAWSLHVGLVLRTLVTQQNREASHTLTANDADFDRFFSGAVCDDGGKTALGKIDAVDPPVRLLQHLPDRQINVFKVGFDEPEI